MKARILALALCFVMIFSLMPTATFAATGTDGIVSISASKYEVNVGDTVDLTFTVDAKTDPLGAINFTVKLPDGLEYVSHQLLYSTSDFMLGSYTNSDGKFGCGMTAMGKNGKFDVLKITVKAKDTNVGANTVAVEMGNMTKVDGSTKMDFGTVEPITITTKAPVAVKDGSVSMSATKDTLTVGETVDVTFTVKADTDPLGAINFTVNLPAGLEYVSHELLYSTSDFMLGSYTNSDGKFGCGMTSAGKKGEFDVLKLTLKATDANIGANQITVTMGNMTKVDGSTKMDFGTVEPITITTKAPVAVKDGSVSMSATKDTLTVGETVDVTFTVKADTDPLGAINFTVNLPAGLEYVSHELLYSTSDFMLGSYTNSDGKFGCGMTSAGKKGEFDVLKLTLKATDANIGANQITVTMGNMTKVDGSTKMDFGTVEPITITTKAPAHICSNGVEQAGLDKTCTTDGYKAHYKCSCGKLYEEADCINEITNLDAWKKGEGKIPAGHDYGTLVPEDKGTHTATTLKDGLKAHYFCDTCDTYFDSSKNPTTKAALTIVNAHSYDTQYGYKENDGHADTCVCGAHNTVTPHTPNISAPTETEDQVCKFCGFVINPKTGHIHKNNLTPVAENGATCTEDGYKAHYKCSCGEYFEDASASVEILDIAAWKAGDGKIAAEGHKYTVKKVESAFLKTAATKCTEYNVYWYACSVCDANAKNDPNATDKFWTSTTAGDHSFTEKLTDADHHVDGTGANCQDANKYYYDCAYCATMGTTTWTSDIYGDHKFTEKLTDTTHLVAGTGANCQDAKEYYYDCAHCATIGTTSWVSTEMGDHSFTEKLTDVAHLVAGTGANCQDAKEYYYDCAHCATIGTTSWVSTEMGDHSFTEKIADAAHLVAGTGANCQDAKEYYYDCEHCATIGTTIWVSDVMGDHEIDMTQWGYKDKATGHAHKCKFCDEHDAVQPHTPNMADPGEYEDKICTTCLLVLEPATGHIHQNKWTAVGMLKATCTTDGHKAYYECTCGKYFEDATATVEISDITAWLAGAGKIPATGHDYTVQLQDADHIKTTATKCTEFNTYWYACSVCGANAKNDPNATDKFWTSTIAGDHSFTEQKMDAAHLVAGTGANCQDAKKYYYDCAYCDEIGTTSWVSTEMGDHSFTEQKMDAAHLVAGTGANCQDVKEYYYDCAHCATIGTTTWASTEVGNHEFDTTQWGYKDVATGHAHKCKFCDEHDAVQPHTPNMDAPTEDDDKICTVCLIVLQPATGHICQSHLTKVPANGASCTVDGNIEYYECSCGKYYTDATAAVEITDKESVVIKASHNYGTLIEEDPAVHTPTELKAGMKAHYFCDKCSTYFTADKVATTESELVIPAPVHEYNTVNGYKEADGHADTCSCGAHNTVVPHTPDREAATENDPIKCSVCGYEITPALGHIHKNNLTKVPAETADCEKDGNIEYYICSCGKYYTDATATVEITDKDSVVIKGGHKYGELVQEEPAVHTATEKKDGMKAHYFCDECDTYFTADKVATTKDALVIANAHSHGTEWKSDKDNHWNECACGDKANSATHKDENSDGKCDVCEYNVGTPGGSTGDDKPSDNPQTGDNSNMILWISLLMLSALGIVATTVIGKKKYSVK